jgi:hypothetical protein
MLTSGLGGGVPMVAEADREEEDRLHEHNLMLRRTRINHHFCMAAIPQAHRQARG